MTGSDIYNSKFLAMSAISTGSPIDFVNIWEVSGSVGDKYPFDSLATNSRRLLGTVIPTGDIIDITRYVLSSSLDGSPDKSILFSAGVIAYPSGIDMVEMMINASIVSSVGAVSENFISNIPQAQTVPVPGYGVWALEQIHIIANDNYLTERLEAISATGIQIENVAQSAATFALNNAYGTIRPIPQYIIDTLNYDAIGYITGGFDVNGLGYRGYSTADGSNETASISGIKILETSGSIDISGSMHVTSHLDRTSWTPSLDIRYIDVSRAIITNNVGTARVATALATFNSTTFEVDINLHISASHGSISGITNIGYTAGPYDMYFVRDSDGSNHRAVVINDATQSYGVEGGVIAPDFRRASATFTLENAYGHPILYTN